MPLKKGGVQISIEIWIDSPFPYASQDPTKMISGEGGELQPIFIELQPVVEESIHDKLGGRVLGQQYVHEFYDWKWMTQIRIFCVFSLFRLSKQTSVKSVHRQLEKAVHLSQGRYEAMSTITGEVPPWVGRWRRWRRTIPIIIPIHSIPTWQPSIHVEGW